MMIGRDGDLWLGTAGAGALRYSPASGQTVTYAHRDGDPRYLSHPTVHALLEDSRGRIWIGTGDGLDLLDPATGRCVISAMPPTRRAACRAIWFARCGRARTARSGSARTRA